MIIKIVVISVCVDEQIKIKKTTYDAKITEKQIRYKQRRLSREDFDKPVGQYGFRGSWDRFSWVCLESDADDRTAKCLAELRSRANNHMDFLKEKMRFADRAIELLDGEEYSIEEKEVKSEWLI